VFHLLTAITDSRAFPMVERAPRGASRISTPSALSRTASWHRPMLCCGALCVALLVALPVGAEAQDANRAKIANALSAGPDEVARNATVRDWPTKDGEGLPVLRQGTNGWVCMPDDPTTPGNDPTCMDATFYAAVAGYFAGTKPAITRVGYAYMLNSDAHGSNTDPTDTKPTATNHWHHAGPHVMMIYPDARLLDGLPTTPTAHGPYVMFPGTPIAHVMLPVASGYAKPRAVGQLRVHSHRALY